MKRRLKAILLAIATMIFLGSCKEESSDVVENSVPTTSFITEAPLPIIEETPIIESETPTPEAEESLLPTCKWSLDIQKKLEIIESGVPFQFNYVTDAHETHSHYSIVGGPLFKQIIVDGKKCLVHADNEEKILISGYDFLGLPFYIYGYEEVHGGTDKDSEYSGWVVPAYTYVDTNDTYWYTGSRAGKYPPLYTYDLYDYEDFRPLLQDCTPDAYFINHGTDFGRKGPITYKYYAALDPAYGGCDEVNETTGFAMSVTKESVNYLVDVNDFSCIYFQNFDDLYPSDGGITLSGYQSSEAGNGNEKDDDIFIPAEEIEPFYSDVLIKGRRR